MNRQRLHWIGAVTGIVVLLALGPADAAHWAYRSGAFTGQRSFGMKFGLMEADGWYGHYHAVPDPQPEPSVDVLELYDPLQGQAVCTLRQEGSVSMMGPTLEVWNHGRVQAVAGSAGALRNEWWLAAARHQDQAHADSTTSGVTWQLLPDDGEAIGDPVWLTFRGDLAVHHSINDRGFGQWTEKWGYRVKGQLDGPYPAPYGVYLQGPQNVRPRPVLWAREKYTYSTRFFDGERVPARIGDTINLAGGVLSWMNIDGVEVSVSERAVSDLQSTVRVTASEADEFAFQGPLTFPTDADQRGVWIDLDRYSPDTPMGPWDFGAGSATQTSEVTTYWLSGEGRCDTAGNSLYDVSFTLAEATDYQLRMILDTRQGGSAAFHLDGPSPINYSRSGNGWTPRWQTGQLAAGDYHLTVNALGGAGTDDWSVFNFDLTFGQPDLVAPPDPPGMILKTSFPDTETLAHLGFVVDTGPGGAADLVPNPVDPADDGALWMMDPGSDWVRVGALVDVQELLSVEFEYLFSTPGKIGILLDGVVLDEIYSEGTTGFVLYSETFELDGFGLTPGQRFLELKLANPDALDPQAYLDDLLVSTVVPEPATLGLLVIGALGVLRRRRRA